MVMKKSNSKKLMDPPNYDRIINKFPQPFHKDSSPYKLDFYETSKTICGEGREVIASTFKICKAIIVGDVSVGKTCIVNRFCNKIFESNYKSTIGVDFEVERFDILQIPFNLQIWDTAGQERFKCIAQSYYRAAKIVIIVFDLSCISSLSNSKAWYREVIQACSEEPFIFLVGTKKDLLSQAAYENVEKHSIKIAKQLEAEYWAVSAKTGENVVNFFQRVAALAFDEIINKESEKYVLNIDIGKDMISFKHNNKKKNKKNTSNCIDTQCTLS